MAKTKECAFCGAEVKGGLLTDDWIDLVSFIPCCSECREKYKEALEQNQERFKAKLTNYKSSTKSKPSDVEIANMFKAYLDEEKEFATKSGNEELPYTDHCFCFNNDGFFAVRETAQGFFNSDVSAEDMVKTALIASVCECHPFTKDDISMIEYAKVGMGNVVDSNCTIYSYEIRLNDQSVMTYKPCITRVTVRGTGFLPFHKKSADKAVEDLLYAFKQTIGSDLPVVKVKKF